MLLARSLAEASAGSSSAARMEIIAITTSNSIRVKAQGRRANLRKAALFELALGAMFSGVFGVVRRRFKKICFALRQPRLILWSSARHFLSAQILAASGPLDGADLFGFQ